MTQPVAGRRARLDVVVVVVVQAVSAALVAGWFATGHASAPDDGLAQLAVLALSERVPGVQAVDGRPTMVVVTCEQAASSGTVARHRLDPAYRRVVTSDPALARRLALPLAAQECQDGYVLVDARSRVRYRTYDPGWARHAFEQEVLLEHLDHAP